MNHLLLVALGGALGAVARHLVNQWGLRVLGPELPYGTLIVNVTGSLLIGVLVGWLAFAGRADATELRFALGVGFLGAFTTMSAYALDVVIFIERKAYLTAFSYAAGTVILSVIAVAAGMVIARRVLGS